MRILEAAAHPAVAAPGNDEDGTASEQALRPTNGLNGAGLETRRHGGNGDLGGKRLVSDMVEPGYVYRDRQQAREAAKLLGPRVRPAEDKSRQAG